MSEMQAADYERMKDLADKIKSQLERVESGLTSLDDARKEMGQAWSGFAGNYYGNALFYALEKAHDSLISMRERADELKRAGEKHELADIEAKKVAMNIEPATWAEV